ncbi:unnamed protein product [Nesidiocoris tenuis]|uniref:DUF7044 domain-containing protein n=1 Tax=Nesidiocoris tenuis TaxID=355587 RepID=A0A6H5HAP8_9HEMI|nr:unnamed protein product [Nesidiocoris tenuis]
MNSTLERNESTGWRTRKKVTKARRGGADGGEVPIPPIRFTDVSHFGFRRTKTMTKALPAKRNTRIKIVRIRTTATYLLKKQAVPYKSYQNPVSQMVEGCQFPTSWAGQWFQLGLDKPVININSSFIETKGECSQSDREKFLVFDKYFETGGNAWGWSPGYWYGVNPRKPPRTRLIPSIVCHAGAEIYYCLPSFTPDLMRNQEKTLQKNFMVRITRS